MPNRLMGDWKELAGRAVGLSRRALAVVLSLLLLVAGAVPPAEAAGVRTIRDAEIEALLQDYARPIFKAAGIRSQSVEIILIPNPAFNAFVADGQKMFIYTGALLRSETPNEIIGVIAHETGHLAGGHLARLRQQVENTKIASLIAGLVGMGAMIAASAATGNGDFVGAGGGILAGTTEAGVRNILSYQRSEEATADRAAVKYLEATGQSAMGMVTMFRRLANESLLATRSADPYLQSHPFPADRAADAEALAQKSPYKDRKDPPALQHRHDLMRAKLSGFLEDPQRMARRYPPADTSLPARYARAVAAYLHSSIDNALPQIEGLIRTEPNNPYFWELKGQALLERARPAQAIEPLRKAVALEPDSGLLRVLLGHALVENGNKADLDEAIRNLTMGVQQAPNLANGYRQLARAYAGKDDLAMAQLATAQGLFVEGEVLKAKEQAKRAQAKLKLGTPAWLRADDIASYNPPSRR